MQDAIATLTVSGPKIAARLLVASGEAFNALNEALFDVQEVVSEDEFRQLKQAVGSVLGHELHDLQLRLKSLYPEVDVDDVSQLARMYKGGF